MPPVHPTATPFPYTTLFRSGYDVAREVRAHYGKAGPLLIAVTGWKKPSDRILAQIAGFDQHLGKPRSEEHTSELQSRRELVCRLLLEKKNSSSGRGGSPDAA